MSTNLEIIALDANNLAAEGICCAFSDKKHREGVSLKEDWLKARFAEGLQYKKLNVRGKVFIEYIPAEYAWAPVDAPGYMFIHCFWVSGRYKGQGWAKQLLQECLNDSQDKNGIVVVSSQKKMPFLADKKFFRKYGFDVCDTASPYFELLVKSFKDAPLPKFRENAKTAVCANKEGFTFVYSDLCPFTTFWVAQLVGFAKKHNIPSQTIKITTRADAQQASSAFPLFSLFYNGKFVTHEMLVESKFDKLVKTLTA